MNGHLEVAITAALAAGKEIMKIYHSGDFQVQMKADHSPLTLADRKANEIIQEHLRPLKIPIISEENIQVPYEHREKWTNCWIVDPLDGTKEFIKRNGEFTVNIALVCKGHSQLGVIYAPALKLLYFGNVTEGKAYKIEVVDVDAPIEEILGKAEEISASKAGSKVVVVASRSHIDHPTLEFIEGLKSGRNEVEIVSRGSSLKFCLVAEGSAHVYPRFGPTMEWDTAAGQAICEAVGLTCKWVDSGEKMNYNRRNLKNKSFSVSHEG